MFQGRKLLIATKHKKENVIAPIFEKEFGVSCFVSDKFDTDTLGTFSGEIARKEDALTTLRNKCLLAMKENDCDLGIASEGSFGMHPTIFIAHADDEMLILIDKKNELEIIAREISTDTNFNGSEIKNEAGLLEFATQVKFPSHGLILKPSEKDISKIVKGITDERILNESFHEMMKEFGKVYVETDMRALYNPTRMKVIEKATLKLVNSIRSLCPMCETPGFVVSDAKMGLPCDCCNSATRSTLSFIYACKKCNHTSEEFYPHKKMTEDPTYCDFCNP
ncbi:DUF6671 family protein [Flavobacterium gawalongense]|uniref:DUF6671 domain-containing protein n=1 Tax=Flavobacterium gawalongense TaxID=2594432 RepID=A0A553BZ58_9FLAO|nr:DUF6671 family protein [Flavobacterium gawalongense]TRX04509.1 hypothetical protein FNW33_00355 [Flavobacterium gawalongense]TRX10396.1 hypothetical protein FNW12_00340 [Flavobacterium gawalongense]TRX13446.1 hypothetical protein FNW11_00860 [Flavobacterium gawalongense]TRX15623.1 hypothetical protein FNW10_00830 [Flavobacterium gawalongense]TRX31461.1 hypothetical protein FNW38_00830 [Flavobacterium gawalongense]